MNGHLSAPPEGVLIESKREDAGLSKREAARRAGISEGWWRTVVKGYQSLGHGSRGAVRDAPAKTIAKMAKAAGVTPEQLETEGQRPDAAEVLRGMNQPHLAAVPSFPGDAGHLLRGDGDLFPGVDPELKARAQPYYREIEARVIAAVMAEAARHGTGIGEALAVIPSGADVFPDMKRERAWWDAVRKQGLASGPYTVWKLAQAIAMAQATNPAEQQNGDVAGDGLASRPSCCRSAPTRGSVSCMSP